MKEFACKSLGYQCGWRYLAKTDDLLTDIVAVHMRDVHGVAELTQEMIGEIKHTFSQSEVAENTYQEEDLALKEFRCKDMGLNCDFHYIAQTKDLIVDGVALHAREAHGISDFTVEMATKVKSLAHTWNN